MRTMMAMLLALSVGCGGGGSDDEGQPDGAVPSPDAAVPSPDAASQPDAPPVPQSCTGCHEMTGLTTGAHAAHLAAGAIRGAMGCAECHVMPSDSAHATAPLVVTFTSTATALGAAHGATPAWSHGDATCTGVYCHGATLTGASQPAPQWVSGGAAQCGACHGMAPATADHPAGIDRTFCSVCHLGVTQTGAIDVASGKHVNGTIDVLAVDKRNHPVGWKPAGHPVSVDFGTCIPCHSAGRTCNNCH